MGVIGLEQCSARAQQFDRHEVSPRAADAAQPRGRGGNGVTAGVRMSARHDGCRLSRGETRGGRDAGRQAAERGRARYLGGRKDRNRSREGVGVSIERERGERRGERGGTEKRRRRERERERVGGGGGG